MRPPITISTALLAVLTTLIVTDTATAQRKKRSSWRDRTGLKHLVYKSDQSFPTKAKGVRNATYCIFLPKNYEDAEAAKRHYPVIYFLHGMNEDSARFRSRGGAPVLDALVGDKTLPEHIFVCVNDGTRRSFYVNGKQSRVEDMIIKDLVPHIEKTYRVKPGAAHRAILGVSMGGYGALKIAFKNPGFFAAVATHSAAILPEKFSDLEKAFPWINRFRGTSSTITNLFGDPVDEELWGAENPLTLARGLDKQKMASLKVYFDCGDRDRYNFNEPNAELHRVLDKRKIPHSWSMVKGGDHGWRAGYNQTALPNSLRFIAVAWSQNKGSKQPEGLRESGSKGAAKKDTKR